MKTRKNLQIISGIVFILSYVAMSCSSPRLTAVSCPDFSNKRTGQIAPEHKRNKIFAFTARKRAGTSRQPATSYGKNRLKTAAPSKQNIYNKVFAAREIEDISSISRIEYSNGLIASAGNAYLPLRKNDPALNSLSAPNLSEPAERQIICQAPGCDTLYLKSGSSLIAKVEEIGQNEIRYRRCDNLNGPVIILSKSDVISISYVNGTREAFPADNPLVVNNNIVTPLNNAPAKTEGLAIAGFAASIVGLFVAGVPLGLLGVIFGAISLGKIKRQPDRLRGRGLAIAAIVIGLVSIIGALVVISTM